MPPDERAARAVRKIEYRLDDIHRTRLLSLRSAIKGSRADNDEATACDDPRRSSRVVASLRTLALSRTLAARTLTSQREVTDQ